MKKLLAVLLSIMMLAMPLTSMAENSVWDNAARQETTITIHDLNADLVAALGGDDTAMAAINDLLAALSLTGYQQGDEAGFDLNLSGKSVLGMASLTTAAEENQLMYVSSALLGGVIAVNSKDVEAIKEKALAVKYADNKAAGEKFLAENKTKEGVVTTPSGLQYKIITKGTGEIPADTSKVKVNYKGTLIDGTEFDSSYKRNEPTTFRANQVIKGWTEALTMMPVGSKWEVYIPQELGYGGRETGGQIKPFSALVFEVELVSIEK